MSESTSVDATIEALRASALETVGQARRAVGCLRTLGLGSLYADELLDEVRSGAFGRSDAAMRSFLDDAAAVASDRARRLAAVDALAAEAQDRGLY